MACRILFIGDDADTCDMVCRMLRTAGFDSLSVSNGAEGIAQVLKNHFDLILVDWLFENGKGIDFCRQLRKVNGSTPILFYTGIAYPSEVRYAQYKVQDEAIHSVDIRSFFETVSDYLN